MSLKNKHDDGMKKDNNERMAETYITAEELKEKIRNEMDVNEFVSQIKIGEKQDSKRRLLDG